MSEDEQLSLVQTIEMLEPLLGDLSAILARNPADGAVKHLAVVCGKAQGFLVRLPV